MSTLQRTSSRTKNSGSGTEVGGIGDTGGGEVGLGALGHRARVTLVTFHGGRLEDVAAQVDGCIVGEGIEHGGAGVGHQDHVGLVDAFPAGDRRTVEHLAVFEQVFFNGRGRHGDVLLFAAGISETEIDPFDVVFLDHVQDFFCAHSRSLQELAVSAAARRTTVTLGYRAGPMQASNTACICESRNHATPRFPGSSAA